MTDKEMLEVVAKAVGFVSGNTHEACWTESEYPRGSGKTGALWNYVGWGTDAELFNPLTDNGDAMKVAVKKRVFLDDDLSGKFCYWYECEIGWGCDEEEATRRAIVRTVAEGT